MCLCGEGQGTKDQHISVCPAKMSEWQEMSGECQRGQHRRKGSGSALKALQWRPFCRWLARQSWPVGNCSGSSVWDGWKMNECAGKQKGLNTALSTAWPKCYCDLLLLSKGWHSVLVMCQQYRKKTLPMTELAFDTVFSTVSPLNSIFCTVSSMPLS